MTTGIRQIDVKLQNSFDNIRKDMSNLQARQEQILRGNQILKDDYDKYSQDLVTKDKFNIIKITIAEINESIKRLGEAQEKLEGAESKKLSKANFDSEVSKMRGEFEKKLQKMQSLIVQSQQDMREHTVRFLTRAEAQQLTSQIGNELSSLYKEVREVKSIKDTITQRELNKKTDFINARIDIAAAEIKKLTQASKDFVTAKQMQGLLDSVNREMNELKANIDDIPKLKTFVSHLEKKSVSVDDFNKRVIVFNDELERLQDSIDNLKKESLTVSEFKKVINALQDRYDERLIKLDRANEKDLDDVKRVIKKVSKEAEKKVKLVEKTQKVARQNGLPYRKTYFLGNFLIFLAFASLIASIVSFFMMKPALTDWLAIGAIGAFVLGLIIRIIVIIKRS